MLVIGSYALKLQGFDVTTSDIDLLMTWANFKEWVKVHDVPVVPTSGSSFSGKLGGSIVDITIVKPGSTDYKLTQMGWSSAFDRGAPSALLCFGCIDLNWAYLLKMSHRFKKSAHFHKTRHHIKWFREYGAVIPDKQFLVDRVKETLSKPPSLNQDKSGFFETPGITYTYDHDSLHRAVAIGPQPAYISYMKEGAEVMCDRAKWELLSFDRKVNGVLEEAMVLALERSVVPHPGVLTADQAFLKGLEAICTTVTSGWFRRFAWENFDMIVGRYEKTKNNECNYVCRFNEGIKSGVVVELNN